MSEENKNGGFGKILAKFLIVGAILFGTIEIVKYGLKNVANNGNYDGNPVLLNRSARNTDISLKQDAEATLLNLKDSYRLIPYVDINNLKISLSYYKKDGEFIKTVTKSVGNVYKDSTNYIYVEHTLSEMMSMSKYSYRVVGGTVSYFA